jgi:hypothetical protein
VYSAELGRFLQTDPIQFDAGDVNLYRYVSNYPTNLIDSSGLSAGAAVEGWIATDVAVSDPTDVAWPKWVGYAAVFVAVVEVDAVVNSRCKHSSWKVGKCGFNGPSHMAHCLRTPFASADTAQAAQNASLAAMPQDCHKCGSYHHCTRFKCIGGRWIRISSGK